MNNINELIQKAHSQAKEMGWWDAPRNTGELLMLIVSECGEALEAHRKGRMGSLSWISHSDFRDPDVRFAFEKDVKDSFSDELADIVIRIADYMGHLGVSSTASQAKDDALHEILPDNVGECLFAISGCLHKYWSSGNAVTSLDPMIEHVFALARKHNIDLWRHIELKLAYNRTRGIRHNKAY